MLPATTQPAVDPTTLPIGTLCPPPQGNESTPLPLRPVAVAPGTSSASGGEDGNGLSVERGLELAIEIRQQLDRLFGWRKRLSPEVRRAGSALRLLFQFVGVAGYAGYFAGMHTFMRVLSGMLMLAGWYAIYWWKLTYPQSADR